jgi:UDP-glucose 4-epimerase
LARFNDIRAAGSHTVLVLLEAGHTVTIIDNLCNSYTRVFEHMKKLAGDKAGNMKFVKVGSASAQPVPHIQSKFTTCSCWTCMQQPALTHLCLP